MDSGFKTQCAHCSTTLKLKNRHLGRVVRCPSCRQRFEVKSLRSGETSLIDAPAAVSLNDEPSGSEPGLAGKAAQEPTLEQLGRFEIKRVVGEGAFGRVYRAYDPQLDRFVALKVPTFASTDKARVRRFLTEAKAAAQLHHPNVVPTYDSGEAAGKLYIASQFVGGRPLNEQIKFAEIETNEAVRWVASLAEAVDYAHQQGIVHRDIKPHNVMLAENGEPQLMDFGLARRVDEDASMTVDGSLLGTPAYMSPEQARGEHGLVGPASDQYSLGVILYELLTGEKPFSGSPHSVIAQIVKDDPPTIRDRDSCLPKDLDAICRKAMSRHPEHRYTSAAELGHDLRRYLDGRPTQARPPSVPERFAFWAKRNPVVVSLAGLLVASLLIGTVVSISFAVDANSQRVQAEKAADEAEIAEDTAKTAQGRAIAAQQQTEKTLARSDYYLAISRWEANRVREAWDYLERVPEKHRRFEWYLAQQQFHGSEMTHYGRAVEVVPYSRGVACSPDGELVASVNSNASIALWNLKTGQEVHHFQLPDPHVAVNDVEFTHDGQEILITVRDGLNGPLYVWSLQDQQFVRTIVCSYLNSLSPDSDELVSRERDRLVFWSRNKGTEVRDVVLPPDVKSYSVCEPAWSPDGSLVALGASKNHQIVLVNAQDGRVAKVLGEANPVGVGTGGDFVVDQVDFTPDGKRLVASSLDDVLRIWSLDNDRVERSIPVDRLLKFRLSPDGSQIAACSNRVVRIFDSLTGTETAVLKGHFEVVGSLCFSPDGRRLLSGSHTGTTKVWDLAAGGQRILVPGHNSSVTSVATSPVSDQIAIGCTDRVVRVFDSTTGGLVHSLHGHAGAVHSVAFHPVEQQLASGSRNDNTVRIWDLQTGECRHVLQGHSQSRRLRGPFIAYNANGQLLASAGGDGKIKVWNPGKGSLIRTIDAQQDHMINAVAFDSTGTILVTCGQDRAINLWSVETGELKRTLSGHHRAVRSVAFSPDRTMLASAGWDMSVRLWDLRSGQVIQALRGHTNYIQTVAFDPAGDRLASAGMDKTIRLWDVSTGEELRQLRGHSHYVNDVAFSRDGRSLVSRSVNGPARIWEARHDPAGIRRFSNCELLAMNADGTLVLGVRGMTAFLLNIQSGEVVQSLNGHAADVTTAAFSSDGNRVLSGDEAGKIILWEVNDGRPMHLLTENTRRISRVGFDPSGTVGYALTGVSSEYISGKALPRDPRTVGWNLATGKKVSEQAGWPSDAVRPVQATDNKRWYLHRQGLVDATYGSSPGERAFRETKAQIDSVWHAKRAELAAERDNTFGALFHRAWQLMAQPDDLAAHEAFKNADLQFEGPSDLRPAIAKKASAITPLNSAE